MDNSQIDTRKILLSLPAKLQDAILSVESSDALYEIGKNNGLFFDQIGKLGRETDKVLMGLTDPTQLVSILSEKLNIDRTKANNIVAEINQKIFVPVKEHLKGLYDKNSGGGTVTAPKKVEQTIPTQPKQPTREDLLRNIENPEGMNLSQSAFDKLRGVSNGEEKKMGDISGLNAVRPTNPTPVSNISTPTPVASTPVPTTNQANPTILDEKMRVATNIPKSVNERGYVKDPYRE